MPTPLSRRTFLASTSAAGAAALAGCASGRRAAPVDEPRGDGRFFRENAVVLFQGDSITDVGRDRKRDMPNDGASLGRGYPFLIASALLRADPGRALRFHNRGESGNRVPDLDKRWEEDALRMRPDVLSILIGVNDYWHTRSGRYNGTVEDYEKQYDALLARTRRALPRTRLVVLEPFVLRVGAVDDSWFPAMDERRAVAERVARRAGAVWVALHDHLTQLAAGPGGPAYWAADGVHPTLAGHMAIAERWRAAVGA